MSPGLSLLALPQPAAVDDCSSATKTITKTTPSVLNPLLPCSCFISILKSDNIQRKSQDDVHSPNGPLVHRMRRLYSKLGLSQPGRRWHHRSDVKLLPAKYELTEPSDLVVLISSMLMQLIQINDKMTLHHGQQTRFHSRTAPQISVFNYLQRLTTHAKLSSAILLSMVYYIDRLCMLYPAFTVSCLTIHRFLIVSATVASKGLSDSFWTNKIYARIGGISTMELAMLELEFLFRMEWQIVPKPEVLVDYYRHLVDRCEGFQIDDPNSNSSTVSVLR
ncbi:hypothetical protein N7524_008677 [Penicillium chrysogenum]|nr:hypothetical protein N7524_010967 [Penicillium chrysogenum]KAJ5260653.1 hypothetical protein N7524_008677 [Penicillium chrysogenum]